MQHISITEASGQLAQLIEAALAGEEIIILRDRHPVIRLTPLENLPKRYPAKAGSAKGLVWMSDDFDEPLEEFKEYME
jgi:antitoxin (DNA-binding transcriptional repressor) of toxin-antitoxin stability system